MANFEGFTEEQRREIEANSPLMKAIEQFINSAPGNKPGPKTEEGKRRVRLNAMKHGFAGQAVLIPEHQKDDYVRHIRALKSEYNPKGYTEEMMVTQLTNIAWQLEGMRAVAENTMSMLGTQKAPFETGDNEQDFMAAQAANFEKHMKEIHLLGLYENRKQRLFNATLDKLRQIQKERKQQELEQLKQAAQLLSAAKAAGEPWNPSDDGFVCSKQEIDRYLRLNPPSGGTKKAA